MKPDKQIIKKITEFKGVLMNGFLVYDPSFITTLALLFEKVYIPNNLEFVMEFAKRHRITVQPFGEKYKWKIKFESESNEEDDPFKELKIEEKQTVELYLAFVQKSIIRYSSLFPDIFQTDLVPKNEPFDVKLIKKGEPGKTNLYSVSLTPMRVTMGDYGNLQKELNSNSIPIILSGHSIQSLRNSSEILQNRSIAAILAMKSVEMLLPTFKAVDAEVILEARDKLGDQLPAFWSTMLKFSIDAKKIFSSSESYENSLRECQNIVDTTIRPTLIDLNNKLELERKNWFYKILFPVAKTIKLIAGKPQMTTQDMLTTSLSLSASLAKDYFDHKRKVDELQNEAGITYLFELGSLLNKK